MGFQKTHWQARVNETLADAAEYFAEERQELAEIDDLSLVQLLGFRSLDARDDTFGILV